MGGVVLRAAIIEGIGLVGDGLGPQRKNRVWCGGCGPWTAIREYWLHWGWFGATKEGQGLGMREKSWLGMA